MARNRTTIATMIDPVIAPTTIIVVMTVDAAPSRSSATTVQFVGSAVADKFGPALSGKVEQWPTPRIDDDIT